MKLGALYAFLKEKLRGAEKIAVLGAGSVLRSDDAAGVCVIQQMKAAFASVNHSALLLCEGETAPENYSGSIRRFCPSHLLVVDAADLGKQPGDVAEIRPEDVGGPTFCSHMLPLRVMIDYLRQETGAEVTLLGIQSKSIAFDGEMSKEVESTVAALSSVLERVIREEVGEIKATGE